MISFVQLKSEEEARNFARSKEMLSDAERERLLLLISDTLEFFEDGELEFGFAISDGCLLIRVFDFGRYYFLYPKSLSLRARDELALEKLFEYAKREELPYIFHEVPSDALPKLLDGVRHADIDAEGVDGGSFCVRVKTECELLDEIPSLGSGEFSLRAVSAEDAEDYARLLTDRDLNKYWGYDISSDYPTDKTEAVDYVGISESEFARGSAISLSLLYENSFVGEGVFYAFDGRGAAELALRLLPEYHGRGLGGAFLERLFEYAIEIGLIRLYALVMPENTGSVAMCEKYMEKLSDNDGRVKFKLELYN